MTHLVRRFRGLGVALVVLALSAGAVFAAAPRLASSAAAPASAHVPTTTASQADEDSGKTETVDNETEDTTQPGDATDATDAQDGHGLMVSTAAQMATPTGFANHGAFVSCVARMGKSTTAGDSLTAGDLALLLPASCPAKPSADAQGSKATGTTNGNAGKAKSSTKSHGHSQAVGKPAVTLPIVPPSHP